MNYPVLVITLLMASGSSGFKTASLLQTATTTSDEESLKSVISEAQESDLPFADNIGDVSTSEEVDPDVKEPAVNSAQTTESSERYSKNEKEYLPSTNPTLQTVAETTPEPSKETSATVTEEQPTSHTQASVTTTEYPVTSETPLNLEFTHKLLSSNDTLGHELSIDESDWSREPDNHTLLNGETIIEDPCEYISLRINDSIGLNISKKRIVAVINMFDFMKTVDSEDVAPIKDMLSACIRSRNMSDNPKDCNTLLKVIKDICSNGEHCPEGEDAMKKAVLDNVMRVIDSENLHDVLLLLRGCQGYE